MVTEFKFPDVGEGITEGRIKRWLVKEGDMVKEDENLAEVETDKAIVDMPSPVGGKVLSLMVPEGEKVKVGQIMITIGGEGDAAKLPAPTAASVSTAGASGSKAESQQAPSGEKVIALPKVRKLAKDKGVDLALVIGTGPGGRITEEDVNSYSQVQKKVVEPTPVPGQEKKPAIRIKLNYDFYGHISYAPYKGLREIIGGKLTTSKFTAPHATAMDDVDMTALWDFRKGMNEELEPKGEKLTFMPFIIKAVMRSLMNHPSMNSTLDEENQEIVLKSYYNIGVATDTSEGLIVPVVKRCEEKGLVEVQKDMDNLIKMTRERTIDLADLRGGTFTISNFGSIGGIYGVPIINYPEAAILGLGQIRDAPRVVDGQIAVRKVMGISVSFDHRIVDGAEVARFLNTLKGYLENPGKLMV